jgi:hypothetical protein
MPSTLILDVGGLAIDLPCTEGAADEPEKKGRITRSWIGASGSSERQQFKVTNVVSTPVPEATAMLVDNMFALGAKVLCSGAVFKNSNTPIYCRGRVRARMLGFATGLWIVSITLVEVGSNTGYTAATSQFLLTSVTSPDDGAALVSTPDGSYPGDSASGLTLGSGLTPPTTTCPTVPATVESATFEAKHLSVPLEPGTALGSPQIQIEYGVVDSVVWATSSFMAKLSVKRSGGIIAGPWSSQWQAMGVLTGGTASLTFGVTLNMAILSGDQFLIEWFARIGLECGQSDNAQRPFIYTGAVPGPRPMPLLIIGGNLVSL